MYQTQGPILFEKKSSLFLINLIKKFGQKIKKIVTLATCNWMKTTENLVLYFAKELGEYKIYFYSYK